MARRVRKTHTTLTVDLLGDPLAYAHALPPPGSDHDWRLHGTVTIDGVTGGMAWRGGGYGIAIGQVVRELNLWERVDVHRVLEIDRPPGIEDAPRFKIEPMSIPGRW